MDISSGLIAKTLGALAAASAVGGGTWWMIENSDEVKRNEITKYDRALIDYINEGGKIQFAVTSGGTTLTEFPKDFSGSDPQKITVTIKIKIGESDGDVNTEGKLTDKSNAKEESKGKRDYLRKLNGGGNGNDWTWTCEMNFEREKKSNTIKDLYEEQRDKVFKTPDDGLFGKLKKAVGETEDEETKKLKKSFIRKCGHYREKEKNREINESTEKKDEIKTEGINFKLAKGETDQEWGTDDKKLFFKSPKNFNRWFSDAKSA